MGFKILLIATKNTSKEDDFENLDLIGSNIFSEWEDHGVAAANLKSSFRLFYIMDDIEPKPSIFEKVSTNGEMIALFIHETVMVSYIAHWENGAMKYSVLHNAQESVRHLEIEGNPPEMLEELKIEKNKAQDKESDVDHIFDIPGAIFKAITGYSYYSSYDFDDEKPWEILKRK